MQEGRQSPTSKLVEHKIQQEYFSGSAYMITAVNNNRTVRDLKVKGHRDL